MQITYLTRNLYPEDSNSINKKNPINNWKKGLNRHFSKKDILMANKHLKRC